jgi:hypothetical protein
MDKYLLSSLVRVDKTVALQPTEPLDNSCLAKHFPLPPDGNIDTGLMDTEVKSR